MKKVLATLVLGIVLVLASVQANAISLFWRDTYAHLTAISTMSDGDFGVVIDASGGATFYKYVTDTWVAAGSPEQTPTIDDPDNWNMSGSKMYGGTWIANAAGTGNLPAVVANMNILVKVEGTGVARVDPNGTEVIYLNGTSCTAGVDIYNDGTTGSVCAMQYRSSGAWSADCDSHWACGS